VHSTPWPHQQHNLNLNPSCQNSHSVQSVSMPCICTQQQHLTLVMWLWSAVWRLKTAWTLNTYLMRAIMGHALGMRVAFDSCMSIQFARWRTLQSRDDWNTCYIGLPTTPTKWKWKNSNRSLLRLCNVDQSVQSLLHQFRNRTGDINVVISAVWQVDNPKFPVCRCSCRLQLVVVVDLTTPKRPDTCVYCIPLLFWT